METKTIQNTIGHRLSHKHCCHGDNWVNQYSDSPPVHPLHRYFLSASVVEIFLEEACRHQQEQKREDATRGPKQSSIVKGPVLHLVCILIYSKTTRWGEQAPRFYEMPMAVSRSWKTNNCFSYLSRSFCSRQQVKSQLANNMQIIK